MTRHPILPLPPLFLAALVATGACTDPPGDGEDVPLPPDAEATDAEADGEPWGDECRTAYDCSNGVFCDGIETCGHGWCFPAEPVACDDGVACTVDACDEELAGCTFTPDDSVCDDRNPCTGV